MAEYIDRYALKNDGHLCWHDGKGNIYYEVDHAPIADVVEVRDGEWKHTDKAYHWHALDECSECGYHFADRIDLSQFNYCPRCGARMKRKET